MNAGAAEVLAALRQRHPAGKALFIDECKLGDSESRRLDAWVLLKTWSPPTTIGYEIKSQRSDFVGDRKWPTYLPVCHELYFACPAKLIAPEELPPDVGLLWLHGSRLVTRRRAPRRAPEPSALIRLMSYVLMSRSRPADNWLEANQGDRAHYWSMWLMDRRAEQHLGYEVSSRVRAIVDEAKRAQRQAEGERDRLAAVRDRLVALGLWETATAADLEAKLAGAEDRRRLREAARLAQQLVRITQEDTV